MSQFVIRGWVHKYRDNINTDIISPAQYMELSYNEIAAHAMEGTDPEFSKKVRPGDILIAGKNFGSGSSRETAPIALKYAGVGAVIAEFFARIFYRNAINIGLPVLELTATNEINDGDELEIHFLEGLIFNHTQGKEYKFIALPEHMLEMIQKGGLVPLLENKLENNRQNI